MMYVLFFFKSGISLYVQTQVIGSSSRRNFPFRDTDISNLRSASEPLGHITVINRLQLLSPRRPGLVFTLQQPWRNLRVQLIAERG